MYTEQTEYSAQIPQRALETTGDALYLAPRTKSLFLLFQQLARTDILGMTAVASNEEDYQRITIAGSARGIGQNVKPGTKNESVELDIELWRGQVESPVKAHQIPISEIDLISFPEIAAGVLKVYSQYPFSRRLMAIEAGVEISTKPRADIVVCAVDKPHLKDDVEYRGEWGVQRFPVLDTLVPGNRIDNTTYYYQQVLRALRRSADALPSNSTEVCMLVEHFIRRSPMILEYWNPHSHNPR
jgi:hypothetical protein